MLGSLEVWRMIARIAYISSIPVWIALMRRRRVDLLAIALFVQIISFLRQEQLEYIETETIGTAGTTVMYTVLYNDNVIEQIALFSIDWGVAVIFIYSCGLVSIFHERVGFIVVFVVLAALRMTQTATALLFGFRFVVTIPLFAFYIYERLTRDTLVLVNIAFYMSGFTFFYCGFFLSAIPLFDSNPVLHTIVHAFWIMLTNLSIFLIIIAVPSTQKINLVVDETSDWAAHGDTTSPMITIRDTHSTLGLNNADELDDWLFHAENVKTWEVVFDTARNRMYLMSHDKMD